MARCLIALGGAESVWHDLPAAEAICREAGVAYDVGAVNDAGADYPGHLTLWCSLHPEKLPRWMRKREKANRNTDYITVCHKRRAECRVDREYNGNTGGSSGLFIVRVALTMFDYERVILCGIQMTPAKNYARQAPWKDFKTYLRKWEQALPDLRPSVRSMSGWTREQLGAPDAAWLKGEEVA